VPGYTFPSDAELRGARVLVLGLGLHHGGVAVCRFLHGLGCRVAVTDLRPESQLREALVELGDLRVTTRLGGHDVADLDGVDFVAVNPAVPAESPFLRAAIARGIPFVSEAGLALSRLASPLALITGSKGKTTTASLLHAMAAAHDARALLAGNVGLPLLDRLSETSAAPVVFEISSFQLDQIRGLPRAPALAAVTNLFPVHLDRHGSFEAYADAKREVLEGAAVAVLNGDDPAFPSFAARGSRVVRFTLRPQCDGAHPTYRLDGDRLLAPGGEVLLRRGDLRIPGRHNVANALAAFAAADVLGIPRATAAGAAAAFRGVRHRLETVHVQAGIRFIDDSIATTPEAAIAALEALCETPPPEPAHRNVLWIAGGKESPFALEALAKVAAGRARAVFTIGESGPRLAVALRAADKGCTVFEAETLDRAFRCAVAVAGPGDVVLLAPAFPSFDQFRNFEERGDTFRSLAKHDW
jgi:UDP-N-acetylmuramoylalanine--D-glutamate ligase